jgi:hypothetical protein
MSTVISGLTDEDIRTVFHDTPGPVAAGDDDDAGDSDDDASDSGGDEDATDTGTDTDTTDSGDTDGPDA